jgi:hypothetical protein
VIDTDDPSLVSMRSDRGAADVDETRSALSAVLGLPMIYRVELTGFVLLEDKPGGLGYQPDEKAILAATMLQVEPDLHALKVLSSSSCASSAWKRAMARYMWRCRSAPCLLDRSQPIPASGLAD